MTRIVHADELPLGACVARDVLSDLPATAPLLRAGAVVTAGYRSALERAGVSFVYVDDELTAGIKLTPALDQRTRLEVTNALTAAFDDVHAALSADRLLARSTVAELERVVVKMIDELAAVDTTTLTLASLASADAYTLEHSIDVAVVGLLVGARIFGTSGRIDHTRHRTKDGAEAALPPAILRKPGPLDEAERAVVERHPLLGFRLFDAEEFSNHALAVIHHHHERWDGSGYPDGLARRDIPQFARIAAVADAYSAMTTRRDYSEPLPPHVALATIRAAAGTPFDPEVVEARAAVVAPYPPGSDVTLADGRKGVVLRLHSRQLDRPLVRILEDASGCRVRAYEVDLADEPELAPAA